MPTLEEAIQAIRMGDREEGRQMLEEILEVDENNEEVWLWLSSVVDTDEDREICLENVLALNPDNIVAQKGLEALQSGSFNVNELLGDVLEEEDEFAEEVGEKTFLDDFMAAEGEVEDEDLVFPESTGLGQQKSGGINVRMIILGVLVLVLLLVLAGLGAAYFIFLGGGGDTTPVESPPAQTTPAEAPGGSGTEQATATPTPTPGPTDTPTATATSALQLPTPRPTNTPSPTATQVVSPTPSN